MVVIGAVALAAAVSPIAALADGPAALRIFLPGIATDRTSVPGEATLLAAEQAWANSGLRDYDITVTKSGYPFVYTYSTAVRAGVAGDVASHCTIAGVEEVACPDVSASELTVPGLFAFIRARLDAGAVVEPTPEIGARYLFVTYGEHGVPVSIETGLQGVPDSSITQRITVTPVP